MGNPWKNVDGTIITGSETKPSETIEQNAYRVHYARAYLGKVPTSILLKIGTKTVVLFDAWLRFLWLTCRRTRQPKCWSHNAWLLAPG